MGQGAQVPRHSRSRTPQVIGTSTAHPDSGWLSMGPGRLGRRYCGRGGGPSRVRRMASAEIEPDGGPEDVSWILGVA